MIYFFFSFILRAEDVKDDEPRQKVEINWFKGLFWDLKTKRWHVFLQMIQISKTRLKEPSQLSKNYLICNHAISMDL